MFGLQGTGMAVTNFAYLLHLEVEINLLIVWKSFRILVRIVWIK